MKINNKTILAAVGFVVLPAFSAEQDKKGIHIGERITLHPYVSLSANYDSNSDSSKHSRSSSSWVVSPGVNGAYQHGNWSVSAGLSYHYHAYNGKSKNRNSSGYNENVSIRWSDSAPNEKGWTLMIGQHFGKILQDDGIASGGRGLGRDRIEWGFDSVLERRVNQYLHGSINGSIYYIDYENNKKEYAPMYGWQRSTVGAEAGIAPSPWTDFIVSGSHHWSLQDNHKDRERDYHTTAPKGGRVARDSRGYSIMAGIATRATEKIKYRLMGGWSHYEYGDVHKANSFDFQASGMWAMNSTTKFMILGSSYYQPSEREYGSLLKVYNVSGGVSKSLVKGAVSVSADVAYRYETHEYSSYESDDYNTDIITTRGQINYTYNNWLGFFGSIEYQTQMAHGGTYVRGHGYNYDRWRASVGVRFSY
ncbi:MAG: outer membrane beta-barrel protein [Kiritimatiellae bacterium]|nr:outer membrane beta-barrel protein [Kiritimatiellia bacterium]